MKKIFDTKKDFILLITGLMLGLLGGLVANIIHDLLSSSIYVKQYYVLTPVLLCFIVYDIFKILKEK
jgi:hypothetical protein